MKPEKVKHYGSIFLIGISIIIISTLLSYYVIVPVVLGMQYDASVDIEIQYLEGRLFEEVIARQSKAFEGSIVYFKLVHGRWEDNYSFWLIACEPLCLGKETFLDNVTCPPRDFGIRNEFTFLIRIERNAVIVISYEGEGVASIEFI